MKVLFVCPAFPPTLCGVGNYTARLINELAARGLEVSLVTNAGPVDAAPYGLKRVHPVPSWKAGQKGYLRTILRSEDPDIVHIQYQQALFHPGWLGLSLPGYFKRWLPRARIVITQHDLNYPYLFKGAGRLGLRRTTVLKKMWRAADAVIIGYQSGADQIAAILPGIKQKLRLVPVGPGLELGERRPGNKRDVCKRYGLDPGHLLLASFGFIYRDKDFPVIFKALDILKQQGLTVNFIHVGGEGDERTYLAELRTSLQRSGLTANAAFTGALPEHEVGEVLAAADIGLLIFTQGQDLGRHSTVPLMLQLGKPLIATAAADGDAPEHPWLAIPAGDPQALADAIVALTDNQRRRTGLAAAAQRLYRARYSPVAIGERTIAIYRELSAQDHR